MCRRRPRVFGRTAAPLFPEASLRLRGFRHVGGKLPESTSPTDLAITTWRTPGALDALRLRPYHRVDVRWTKYFHPAVGQLSLFGEVYNLLGTVNPRGFWRDAVVQNGQVILTTGEIHQWPRLPVAGFNWQF